MPTFLMGLSLPVLSKAFPFGNLVYQARYISLLYFVNTLGAAVGALVTGFFLVRQLGYDRAIWVGAAGNGLCALAAFVLSQYTRRPATPEAGRTPDSGGSMVFTPALLSWSGQYFLAGLAALSLELIWFRVLETLIKSVSVTFAVLLAIYLGSMAIGTAFGTYLSRPSAGRSVPWRARTFLLAQFALYAYTAVSIACFIPALPRLNGLRFLWDHLGSYEPNIGLRFSLVIYGAVPLFLLFVPTFLMGLSFSLSQSLIQTRQSEVGRRVGWLQFVNIMGGWLWGRCWLRGWVFPCWEQLVCLS